MVTGAFMASVRESSRPDPGGFSSLIHGSLHRTLRPPERVKVSSMPVAPTLSATPSGRAARLVQSKTLVGWRMSTAKWPTPVNPPALVTLPHSAFQKCSLSGSLYPNYTITAQSPSSTFFGPAGYEGPKDLAVIDSRRALIVYGPRGPRALVIYDRPSSLSTYMGPINYIRFWVNACNYELVARIYRPRFQKGGSLFKEYRHLHSANFEQWEYEEAEDFIDTMLTGDRSILRKLFNPTPPQHLTIGDFNRRLEEQASRTLAHLYALGIIVSLALMACEECLELHQAFAEIQPVAYSSHSDSAALCCVKRQIPLDAEMEEMPPCTMDQWWNGSRKETESFDFTTIHFETSISEAASALLPTHPTPRTTPVLIPVPSRAARNITFTQRPSGPRFKSAAWKRCRTK